MKQLFLFTKNKATADNLMKNGFQLVNKSVDGWTFINHSSTAQDFSLSEFDKGNISVTDKLCI